MDTRDMADFGKRFCKKCLLKDMSDGEYYRTVYELSLIHI